MVPGGSSGSRVLVGSMAGGVLMLDELASGCIVEMTCLAWCQGERSGTLGGQLGWTFQDVHPADHHGRDKGGLGGD
eukprot:865143-Alexandrium_andersonii.AAC.1